MSEETTEVTEAAVPAYEAFQLVRERAEFTHWNPRMEMHGEDPVPACDLKFKLRAPNSILKKIRTGLVESFYEHDRQSDLEGDFMRKLKHPQLGPVAYDWEIPNVRVTIHDQHNEAESVIMAGGKANGWKLNMLDGGTVEITFRLQFSDYDEEVAPGLIRCNKQTVMISLESEAAEEKPDNFTQAELLGTDPAMHSDARKAAEAMFTGESPADELTPESVIMGVDTSALDNVEPIKGRKKKAAAA